MIPPRKNLPLVLSEEEEGRPEAKSDGDGRDDGADSGVDEIVLTVVGTGEGSLNIGLMGGVACEGVGSDRFGRDREEDSELVDYCGRERG